MASKKIRLLNAEEIECRVGTISEKGLSLLLYKDARADMKILDETFGINGWQRSHEVIDGNLYCTVSIWDEEKQQWISKCDVGTESYTEKEKGAASDSFKRACVSIGIGRELYSAPFIWIPASKVKIENRGGKYTTFEKFRVKDIVYDKNREIKQVTIVNQTSKVVFSNASEPQETTNDRAKAINAELKRTGVDLKDVLKRFGVESLDEMTDIDYKRALNGLKKTKPKVA